MKKLTLAQARRILAKVPAKYLPKSLDLTEFRLGYPVELEHRDVTGGDEVTTSRIVFAHLREVPDYYAKLLTCVEPPARKKPRGTRQTKSGGWKKMTPKQIREFNAEFSRAMRDPRFKKRTF